MRTVLYVKARILLVSAHPTRWGQRTAGDREPLTLKILLDKDEHPPLPVHLLAPQGRSSVRKLHAFVDFAVPRFKRYFEQLSRDAKGAPTAAPTPVVRGAEG